MRQSTVTPEECFYGDNEWNVSLWGTYAFTGTSSRGVGVDDFVSGHIGGDRYLETDHAWGGGGSVKYFWHKYFGFGVEGFVLSAKRTQFDFEFPTAAPAGFAFTKSEDRRAVGSVLGSFTLRFPIGCSRFAPMFGQAAAPSSVAARGTGSSSRRLTSQETPPRLRLGTATPRPAEWDSLAVASRCG